jgi:hypothetical protein
MEARDKFLNSYRACGDDRANIVGSNTFITRIMRIMPVTRYVLTMRMVTSYSRIEILSNWGEIRDSLIVNRNSSF